jgi:hypothetical protein
MERKIQEDFTMGWKPLGIAFGVVLGVVLVTGISTHDLEICLTAVGLAVAVAIYFWLMRAWSIRGRRAEARIWVETDSGLQCTYGEPPETETIRWSQIRRMRWNGAGGLLVIWEESATRGPQFRDEFHEGDIAGEYRASLRVRKPEADALMATCRRHQRSRAAEGVAGAETMTAPVSVPASPAETPAELPPETLPFEYHHAPIRRREPAIPKLSRQLRNTVRLGSVMGLFCMGGAGVNMVREFPSGAWPSVPGKVLAVDFTQLAWDNRHSPKGKVVLAYQYELAGQWHTGQQYSVRQAAYVEVVDLARAFAAAHPAGSPIPVYYDPKQPGNAVLQPGIDWQDDGAFLVLGGFFLVIALTARWAALRKK